MRKYLTKKMREDLSSRLAKINEIPAVNRGGCGFVSLHLHDFLKEKGYKPQILYCHTRVSGINNAKNNVVDSCSHAVVRIGNFIYDSEGREKVGRVSELHGTPIPVTREYVKASLRPRDMWNWAFDRRNVKKIRKILGLGDGKR